ncbi:MAG TPA: type II secretion system minor pseudopilin GspH [Gammaproteobacteria bacterium]|nr:type II secretion system minor pseudopilin GspH [Gammaproteobacteria bacterium]
MSARLRGRLCGFTLIELLVTLVIISIIISMATLSLGNNEARQVQDTAGTLTALIELAKEEALFNGQEMGIAFWQGGYVFYRQENLQWVPIVDDNEFRPRDLPEGLWIAVYLDGLDVDLPGNPEQRKRPQVYIMSSGEITPFEAKIGTDNTQVTLKADALGNLAYVSPPS